MINFIGFAFAAGAFVIIPLTALIIIIRYFIKKKKGAADGRKTADNLLLLSFMPHILLLLYAAYSAVFGIVVTGWFGGSSATYYGLEAFSEILVWNGLSLIVIPVIPVCTLYQLVRLIILIVKLPEIIRKRIIITVCSAAGAAVFIFAGLPLINRVYFALKPVDKAMLGRMAEYDEVMSWLEVMYMDVNNTEKFDTVTVAGHDKDFTYTQIISDLIKLTEYIKTNKTRDDFKHGTVYIQRASRYDGEKGKQIYSVGFDMTVRIEFLERGGFHCGLNVFNHRSYEPDKIDFSGFDYVRIGGNKIIPAE